jgi:hypothetical protein
VHAAWLANEEGRVIEYTRTMIVRERTVWLTDYPGAMVEDFDRVPRPFNTVHGGQHRRQHKAYLD